MLFSKKLLKKVCLEFLRITHFEPVNNGFQDGQGALFY